jgi:hypothetical protein
MKVALPGPHQVVVAQRPNACRRMEHEFTIWQVGKTLFFKWEAPIITFEEYPPPPFCAVIRPDSSSERRHVPCLERGDKQDQNSKDKHYGKLQQQ